MDAPNLCCLLAQASHALTTRLTAALEQLDLSPRSHQVLCQARAGEHTQIELARLCDLDKTTMVVTIDELEAAGLAERRPSPTDRRARVIAVTEAGSNLLAQADAITERVHRELLEALPEAQRESFVDALRQLTDELLAEPASSSRPVRRPRERAGSH